MSEKKVGKRLLTWVLVLVMTLSLLPLNVLAVEGDTAGNTNMDTKYSTANSGANLVKSATKNADGTYTIQLESWVTGTVESTTGSVPLDIVLVLDQSGSMNGDKLANLKNAVSQFVNKIKQDAADHSVTHRIAIVGFASGKKDGMSNSGTVSPDSSQSSWINTGLFIGGKLKNYQTYQGQGTWENVYSHRPNISSVISGYKQPSKSAQSIEITGFIEKSKPSQIIFLYTLLPLTA